MKKFLLMPVVLIHVSCILYAQTNTDSLFQSSLDHSRAGRYRESVAESKKILQLLPGRADVMIHLANVFAWTSEFDSSKIYIEKAYSISPQSGDLYDSWLNILLWNKEYDELFRVAGIAEANGYANKTNLALKKLISWKETGNYKSGTAFIKLLDNEIRSYPAVKAIYNELYSLSLNNSLSAFYSLDFFRRNVPRPQSFAFIDYSFKTGRNTGVLRQNFSNRSGINDFQTEADYYYKFRNRRYLYLNYGVGYRHEIFPAHRAGAEIFFPVIKTLEVSAGARYLKYEIGDIFILTGHVEKYISASWLSFRPFYVIRNNGNAFSLLLSYRFYERNPANYWGLEASYGNSPDDRYVLSNLMGFFRLNAYRIRAEKNIALNVNNELRLVLGFSDEEYSEDIFRNRYIAEILLRHRF